MEKKQKESLKRWGAGLASLGLSYLAAKEVIKAFGSSSEEWENGNTDILLWKVDLGTSIFINGPSENILIDLADRKGFSPVKNLKRQKNRYGIDSLDRLIISHPDEDHIDDIENFYELCYKGEVFDNPSTFVRPLEAGDYVQYKRDEIYPNRESYETKVNKYLEMDAAYKNHFEGERLRKHRFQTEGGINFQFFSLSPEAAGIKRPQDYAKGGDINNLSVLTIMSYEGFKLVYPGDLEKDAFEILIDQPEVQNALRDTDILVASHHGRDSGYHGGLFDLIQPDHVILSDKKNSDTSVPRKYRTKAEGGMVEGQDRSVLTTRSDSVIRMNLNGGDYNVTLPDKGS